MLVILLLVATAISAGLWAYERDAALPYEAIAIFAVVLLNATMGYVQESRAEAAVAALRAMSAADATVIRDGERRSVPAAELVPGDIILIEEGDTIPADARLIESTALQTAEAALTGESLPVTKDTGADRRRGAARRSRTTWSSAARRPPTGTARRSSPRPGMRTEMGRIAGLLKETPDEADAAAAGARSHGQDPRPRRRRHRRRHDRDDHPRRGRARPRRRSFDVLILGVALAVAAVPEGLPAVVTAVLSIGVQRMARRNAIVRHLAAVETLGSASVIASDKTGTLTKNEMTVRVVVTASGRVTFDGSGYAPSGAVRARRRRPDRRPLRVGARARARRRRPGEQRRRAAARRPVDGAGRSRPKARCWSRRARPVSSSDALDERLPRVGEVPFSSERKLMSTIHRDAEQRRHAASCSPRARPDVLLARCTRELVGDERRPLTPARRARDSRRRNEALAGEALRTLGVAGRWLTGEALAEHRRASRRRASSRTSSSPG